MKKIILLIVCLLCITACSDDDHTKEQQKTYESIRTSLMENGDLQSFEIPFDYSIEIKEKDGKYRYTISVSNPQVAMYNIEMMILNPAEYYDNYESPSVGIYSETNINMIPNQTNIDAGYYSELELTGVSKEATFDVYAVLAYKDSTQSINYQTYFSFHIIDGVDSKEGLNYEY